MKIKIKIKISKALCLLITALLIAGAWCQTSADVSAKGVYYVATDGSDSNTGSFNAPFKTINKAIQKMNSGDICYIKGGEYNESIIIEGKSKLSFVSYSKNDKPLISGADMVTGWTKDNGSIWYADCRDAFIQSDYNRVLVFCGGKLADEARWPNTASGISSTDEAHPLLQRATYAAVESVQARNKITVSGLPDADLTDGYIWIASNPSYWSYNLNVLSNNGNQITFTDLSADTRAGDLCYLYGSKSLMDAEGEWYLDKDTQRLYFYTENPLGPQNVEIRNREYAVKITNSSEITLDGIDVKGAVVQMGDGAENCEIKNAVIETTDKKYPTAQNRTYHRASANGVLVGGEGNLIYGCEIKNMYGRGVSVEGNSNRIINNYIHDINFEHNNTDDGIRITGGASHAVHRNTVTRTGRSAIGAYCTSSVISYNHIYDGNRLSKDSGLMYFNDKNYENTEVHHNVLGESTNNTGMQYGLYLDSFSSGMLIYNNLIYGQETGGNTASRTSVVGPNTIGNLFANNTYINTKTINGLKGDRSGTAFVNNLFVNAWKDTTWAWSTMYETNNVIADISELNEDYTLSAAAESAIDKGVYLSGITENYVGASPDCGAFEYGRQGGRWAVILKTPTMHTKIQVLTQSSRLKTLFKTQALRIIPKLQ